MDSVIALSPDIQPNDRVLNRYKETTTSIPFAYVPYQVELHIHSELIRIIFNYDYSETAKTTKAFDQQPSSFKVVQGKYSGKLIEIEIKFDSKEHLETIFNSLMQHLWHQADSATKEHNKWNISTIQRLLKKEIWPTIERHIPQILGNE